MKHFVSALPLEPLNKLLASDIKLSLYASGSCSSILGWITLLPGSSKNIAETCNPYTKPALDELLGYSPSKFVDFSVSRDLAFKAFSNTQKYMYIENGNSLHFKPQRVLGVGITGALRSNYARRGDHHLYLSLLDQKKYLTYHIVLDKNKRSREEEDYFVSYNALNIINNVSQSEKKYETPSLVGEALENDSISVVEEKDTIDFLLPTLENQTKNIIFMPDGKILVDQIIHKCIVIPGSFNPIHHGHVALGENVAERFGVNRNNIIFELSAKNADKGLISREELDKRVKMIVEKGFAAMLTQRPLFYSKNEYLREGHFVVGADTYKRIVDSKYYEDSEKMMIGKLREFERYKNCLVVAPRLNSKTNELEGLKDFDVPEVLSDWIHELKGFRVDISSTEIRKKMQEKEEGKK